MSTVTIDMEYSATGQMISLTKASDGTNTFTQSNVYNHDSIRIGRIENGAKREYYYDGGIVAFTKDGNDISSANVLSPEGAAIGTYRDSNYYTYLNDIQGSTTNLVKADGSLAAAYDYTDFGETTEITGNDFDNQICYTGGIYDKGTELYYLNARYYDPAIGRFISQDTYRGEMNDPGQWHLYAYCANNPINYVDPSGHARKHSYYKVNLYRSGRTKKVEVYFWFYSNWRLVNSVRFTRVLILEATGWAPEEYWDKGSKIINFPGFKKGQIRLGHFYVSNKVKKVFVQTRNVKFYDMNKAKWIRFRQINAEVKIT